MMLISRILLFVILLIPASWTDISKKNATIRAAAAHYGEANYEAAVEDLQKLINDFNVSGPYSRYNLALSYHYNEQLEEAQRTYSSLLSEQDKNIVSFASNQNGIILGNQKSYEEALAAFKFALIKDPNNDAARYNYELLSRWMEENQDQDSDDQDGDDQQDQEDQQDQDNDQDKQKSDESKDGEGDEKTDEDEASKSDKMDEKSGEESQQEEQSEEPSDLESDLSDREKTMEKMKERLEQMNLTPEQAQQILDAMNAAELRYIQQNRKKPTKRPERGLPDW